jgi:hypothetical protein
MAEDIKEQLLKCGPKFALPINKSTHLPQLLVSAKYRFEENIREDFMFCRPLTDRTIGSALFKAVNDY